MKRGGDPIKFSEILMWQLKRVLDQPSGSIARHRELRDMEDLLSHLIWRDPENQFDKDKKEANEKRDDIEKGNVKNVKPKEALELHQSLWLGAIIRLMKRFDLLGDEHLIG